MMMYAIRATDGQTSYLVTRKNSNAPLIFDNYQSAREKQVLVEANKYYIAMRFGVNVDHVETSIVKVEVVEV